MSLKYAIRKFPIGETVVETRGTQVANETQMPIKQEPISGEVSELSLAFKINLHARCFLQGRGPGVDSTTQAVASFQKWSPGSTSAGSRQATD